MNTGLVGFNFKVVGMDPSMDPSKNPGKALVIPHTVSIQKPGIVLSCKIKICTNWR